MTTLKTRGHRITFRFTALGDASSYVCALVRLPHGKHFKKPRPRFVRCASPKTYRHLAAGRYLFEVRALGPGGAERTPLTHRFTVG
jgi:hypothetical protein